MSWDKAVVFFFRSNTSSTTLAKLKYRVRQKSNALELGAYVLGNHLPSLDSICVNGHFPGGPGLAGTRMSPF